MPAPFQRELSRDDRRGTPESIYRGNKTIRGFSLLSQIGSSQQFLELNSYFLNALEREK